MLEQLTLHVEKANQPISAGHRRVPTRFFEQPEVRSPPLLRKQHLFETRGVERQKTRTHHSGRPAKGPIMHAARARSRALLEGRVEEDANLPLGDSVAFAVEGEVRRRKRVGRDARKELRDDFGGKLLRHAGRQRPRRTPQFIRHETERETPRIRIHFAQELLPTLILRTPY